MPTSPSDPSGAGGDERPDGGAAALLASEWAALRAVAADLAPADFDRPTDLPGWSVRDNLSHVIGVERMLLGLPADPPVERPAWVRNDFGAGLEAAVAARRGRSGAEVVAELDDVLERRVQALAGFGPDDWARLGPAPGGEVPYRDFMRIRIFDCWAHEQDIRRAVGRPGHLDGPVVEVVLAWHRRNLPYVVGKRAGAPDGASVRAVVHAGGAGPDAGTPVVDDVTVRVTGGRATVVAPGEAAAAATAAATIETDVETWNALLCGRWNAEHARSRGRVRTSGDAALAAAVLEHAAYVI